MLCELFAYTSRLFLAQTEQLKDTACQRRHFHYGSFCYSSLLLLTSPSLLVLYFSNLGSRISSVITSNMGPEKLSMVALLGVAAAADVLNPVVDVLSCQSLSCSSPENSICSSEDSAGPPRGVGIAANAVNSTDASLSFTLIDGLDENGFTGMGSYQYEYSDQQLFVGLDPTLNQDNYPSGCVLMLQYLAQTFPMETFPDMDGNREGSLTNTTSCDGVIDSFCQSSISEMIQSFDATESNNATSSDKCTLLTSHVNARLQENHSTCGGEGTWIANFMNVTGGALPTLTANTDLDDRLGSDDCSAVLPADYQLYKVASMRQLYFADPPSSDSEYYGKVFGGRDGYTPVITVMYADGESSEILEDGVQFSCLQTYQSDGEAREDLFQSRAVALSSMISNASLIAALLCVSVLFLV